MNKIKIDDDHKITEETSWASQRQDKLILVYGNALYLYETSPTVSKTDLSRYVKVDTLFFHNKEK